MTGLINKPIILGVSGGIATYKNIDLIKYLKELRSEVKVIMTKSAKKFITPLSLQTKSYHPVFDNFITPQIEITVPHIKLAKWTDLISLAPTIANLLKKLTVGLSSNDLLFNLCLATTAMGSVAPSMNQQMYNAIVTQTNLDILRKKGILIWDLEYGHQSCNDIRYRSMTDPKILAEYLNHYSSNDHSLSHLNIMITVGPTYESLDPIRFFTNYNSGKIRFAIVQSAANKGETITLITGPIHLHTPTQVRRINIISALDMKKAVTQNIKNQQIFIGCAAISDYRIFQASLKKIKKDKNTLKIIMIKNSCVIAEIGSLINKRSYVVRFSAETNNIKNAQYKRI